MRKETSFHFYSSPYVSLDRALLHPFPLDLLQPPATSSFVFISHALHRLPLQRRPRISIDNIFTSSPPLPPFSTCLWDARLFFYSFWIATTVARVLTKGKDLPRFNNFIVLIFASNPFLNCLIGYVYLLCFCLGFHGILITLYPAFVFFLKKCLGREWGFTLVSIFRDLILYIFA